MTREQKLALLMGFALVLVVAVLVSDHLSSAGRAELGSIVADSELPVGGSETAAPDPLPQTYATNPRPLVFGGAPEHQQEPMITARSPGDALRDALADGGSESPRTSLADRIRETMAGMPTAAQTDEAPATVTKAPERTSTQPKAEPRQNSAPKRYAVKADDSLWKIATREYGDGSLYVKLAEYNKGRVGDEGEILVGSELLIPTKEELTGEPAPRPASASKRSSGETKTARYTVKEGDTLGEIAATLLGSARRWREIVDMNQDVIDDPDSVPAGVVLKIPSR